MPDAAGFTVAAAEAVAPEFSDDALALEFSARHDGQLLYVAEWGRWLRWDGTRWAEDTTLAVFDMARAVCREAADRAAATRGAAHLPVRLTSAQTVAAVERLARADRRHARAAADFDADPWALNTPGGVVDLRSGETRSHRRGDLFTKVTAAAPEGDCPGWRAFLVEATQGDADLVAYLQRWAGYCLTGETREHAFAFLYGPGGNGKSVFLNTLAAAMGDYATAADMALFAATRGEQHPTGLADLRGARLVTAQETEAGRALAEARIKAVTGGDRIKARFMRGDFFAYQPRFKLLMAGNHRPVLRNPDPAMRRRLHFLPLTSVPRAPDPELPQRLREELPGILAWAVEGCAGWLRTGLAPPDAVRDATDEFFADQDTVAGWAAERCEREATTKTASRALFRDWQQWAQQRGEEAGTEKAFSERLERHFAKKREAAGMAFLGVKLRPSDTGAW
jgi:putative DNA primase/helicase